ncbi:MAG TPA: DUF2157 domain-containing protein [Terracidiphilus sp.]
MESLLTRWQSAGVLDAGAAQRIRAYELEQKKPAGMRWEVLVALILGAILLACGVALFVSAHWEDLGPAARFALVIAMVAAFHIGGGLARRHFRALSMSLHAVGTLATGAAIALVGQIFNIQEHWPAAILMWAIAAAAGWLLLGEQAQQLLTLVLIPAWMLSELAFYTARYIGRDPYIGRFLFVWAILYMTFFVDARRRETRWILFAAGAIAAVAGTAWMLTGWESSSYNIGFVPFSTRVWAWIAIAAIPLVIAAFHGHKGLLPIAAAIALAAALPWCQRVWIDHSAAWDGTFHDYTRNEPNLAAHMLVAAFAVFLIWHGVRLSSRAIINAGMVGFAIVVGWFYFSNLFDKLGRSLGLISLGILFLLGGWALEKMRRKLIAGITAQPLEAQ